ncbi:MAG: FecR family protein [Thermodesulfobacteriota bacterium]
MRTGIRIRLSRREAFIIPVVFCLLMIAPGASGKDIPAGKIDKVEGAVSVVRSDGKEVKAQPGLSLYAGDQITTGKGAKAWFSLEQGKRFQVGEEGQLAIDELSSSEVEDSQPTLRLILGYLWSKLDKIGGKPSGLELHTPTAVMGIRGTEFETVVALDATSVVAVDEGGVEIEVDDHKAVVEQGQMIQVEVDAKPGPPEKSPAKDMRDWEGWRKKRVQMLFQNLPGMAPKFAHRFSRAEQRMGQFTEKVNQKGEEVRNGIRVVRQAKAEADRQKIMQARKLLMHQVAEYKPLVGKFRKGLNRVRSMGKASERLEKFVAENRTRYSPQQLTGIDSNLKIISQKREELKTVITRTVMNIRETFRELRALREEARETGRR